MRCRKLRDCRAGRFANQPFAAPWRGARRSGKQGPGAFDPRFETGNRIEAAHVAAEPQGLRPPGPRSARLDDSVMDDEFLEESLAELVAQRASPALLLERDDGAVGQAH